MKLLTGCMLAVGLLLPMTVLAHPPRPEEAVARLDLSPELREQVLATFAAAKTRHEAWRKAADAQRAANDTAFCAARNETQAALAKLLNAEQLAALHDAMRLQHARSGDGPRGDGPRGMGQRGAGPRSPGPHAGMGGPRDGMRGGPERREAMEARDGQRRPPPPRCHDPAPQAPAGE